MTGYRVVFDREKLVLGWKKFDCRCHFHFCTYVSPCFFFSLSVYDRTFVTLIQVMTLTITIIPQQNPILPLCLLLLLLDLVTILCQNPKKIRGIIRTRALPHLIIVVAFHLLASDFSSFFSVTFYMVML